MKASAVALVLLGLIVLAGLVIMFAPAEAQHAGKVYRIGALAPSGAEEATPALDVLRQRMSELGWVEGTHYVLEIPLDVAYAIDVLHPLAIGEAGPVRAASG